MFKLIRDIFDTVRMVCDIRKHGFKGDLIILTTDDYRDMLERRNEIALNGELLWATIDHMILGGSACDSCMFDPCPVKKGRGCMNWCPRDLTDEERKHGVGEVVPRVEPSTAPESGEGDPEVHAGDDPGAAESAAL